MTIVAALVQRSIARLDYGAGAPGARSSEGGDTQEEAGVRSGGGSSSGIIVADASLFVALAGVANAFARCDAVPCDMAE